MTKELECAALSELVRNCFLETVTREKILALEAALLKMPQAEIPLQHQFANGLYARSIAMPKGTLLVGKLHKMEHFCIVSKGDVSVLTENGPQRVMAPYLFTSYPGTKRVLYAHEDSVWTTVHPNPTNEQDTDTLESVFIASTYADLDGEAPAVLVMEGA